MAGHLAGQIMYDLVWASETLARFENQYPNECKEVRSECHLSRNDVVRFVGADQVKWRAFKKAAKFARKYESAAVQFRRLCEDVMQNHLTFE